MKLFLKLCTLSPVCPCHKHFYLTACCLSKWDNNCVKLWNNYDISVKIQISIIYLTVTYKE